MKYTVTSQNTKKIMAASLKKAMKTHPLSKITVSEIVKDCGFNRKTFYYHFEDIYALLKWMFEEEAIEVVKNFNFLVDYEEAICFVIDYVERNEYIINCAYDSMGRDEMKRFFYADFIELVTSIIERAELKTHSSLDLNYKDFLCKFYTEALAGILVDWIKNRSTRNRRETIDYISHTLRTSITAILTNSSKMPNIISENSGEYPQTEGSEYHSHMPR